MKCIDIYKNGLSLNNVIFVVGAGKLYKIHIPYSQSFAVFGDSEANAIDTLADFLEDNNFTGLYKTYDELWDEAEENGDKFEDYEQSFICCGNHGIYLSAELVVKEVEKGDEIL